MKQKHSGHHSGGISARILRTGMFALAGLAGACGGGGGGSSDDSSTAAVSSNSTTQSTSSSSSSSSSTSFGTYLKAFSADSPWNSRPVDPVLGTDTVPTDDSGYKPSIGGGIYSTMFALASASDAAVTIYPLNTTINMVYGTATSVTIPHWPEDAIPASGSDGHLDVYDPTTGIIHSFWKLQKATSGEHVGEYVTAQYNWTRIDGRGWGNPALYYQGARATGVPPVGGLIRTHEIDDGDSMYRHALAMSLTYSGLAASPAFVFPATSADSDASSTNTGAIPEGSLLMLPESFDESQITSDKLLKVVRTLKTYGARVVDRNVGTPFAIYVESITDTYALCADYADFSGTWSNTCSSELHTVRAGLRPVESESGWIDGNGNQMDSLSTKLRMVAGRGSVKSSNLTSVAYDYINDRINVVAGANGTNTAVIEDYPNSSLTTPKWTAGKTYVFSVTSSSTAIQATLSLFTSSGSVATTSITNGQSATITAPDGVWSFAHINLSVADNESGWIHVTAVEQ